MGSDSKLANAVGAKTARACDTCAKKRARWYCTADDAFLCQRCDAVVHSANPLARRHERVRLKTASSSMKPLEVTRAHNTGLTPKEEDQLPTWHQGFTRKARTPRHKRQPPSRNNNPIHDLVPDQACSEEEEGEENEDQLLYRVPVLDPFLNEFCTSTTSNEAVEMSRPESTTPNNDVDNEWKEMILFDCKHDMNQEEMHASLPSEMDHDQFAADVESLLGKGLDDESFHMEGLGLMDCKEENLMEKVVKVEEFNEEEVVGVGIGHQFNIGHLDFEIDFTKEAFEFNFEDGSLVTCEEDGRKVEIVVKSGDDEDYSKEVVVKEEERGSSSSLLRLDYESVIACWPLDKSPWTNGQRPHFHSFSCFPYCMGNCGKVHEDMGMKGHAPIMTDGGREARVSRYREKRRTRLFSKKIRYEVRKLNAEKRPRMKGRFVKRENLAAASSAFP